MGSLGGSFIKFLVNELLLHDNVSNLDENSMPNDCDIHDKMNDYQLTKDIARRNIMKPLKFCDFNLS